MTTALTEQSIVPKPLRVWPGALAVALQWLALFVIPIVWPEAMLYGMVGGVFVGGATVLLWWLFFSRAPWRDRIGAVVLLILGFYATSRMVHESIANGGQGMLLLMLSIPVLDLALVVWALIARGLSTGIRRATLVATILFAWGIFALVRTGGMTGDGASDFHWRWTPTPEERLLASAQNEEPRAAESKIGVDAAVTWPGFRGAARDGIVRGVHIATDWSQSPPIELWRRPVGPGWSSFAVGGDVFYTQEQRGEEEAVVCYSLSTGQLVWKHSDTARFWESTGGAGPRATPTLHDSRVYTLGATGIVNALNAADGQVAWTRNAAEDTGAKVPGWGFAGSPLVIEDLVIVATGGRLVAYDLATGNPRWSYKSGGSGYSSPRCTSRRCPPRGRPSGACRGSRGLSSGGSC